MSNSAGFAVTRTHSNSRFYHPPAIRRHHQQLLLQQQQKQRQEKPPGSEAARVDSSESEVARGDSDESALSAPQPNSAFSSSAKRTADFTHLDRLIESVTPSVRAHHVVEVRTRGGRSHEADLGQYFSLGDLWEAFREWSVYGVGVPLLLNGSEPVKQYYVPSLSGIQLYININRARKPGEDSDAESTRETGSRGSSDFDIERKEEGNIEVGISSGQLVFEYLELEQPHHRKPLYDKVSNLASQFPDLKRYKSCDLLPSSWISIAWYPIYRIPVGPTLQNLDTSFLTFHRLSTHSRSKAEPQLHVPGGRKVYGQDSSSRFSLPVFGLASYKLRGSILTPNSDHEWQQANSLLQAADDWLRQLQVNLPDYQFFISHNSNWR